VRTSGRKFPGHYCVMIADTRAELNEMAETCRLKMSWCKDHDIPQFHLTPADRATAIEKGASDNPVEFKACLDRWKVAMGVPSTHHHHANF
jgi:hypothetical protein